MRRRAASLAGVMAIVVSSALVSAQAPGKPVTGNPTPGIAQPEPPNLADRVTFVGCLRITPRRADALASADKSAATADPNSPSNSRFELANAARQDRVPEGTGGSPQTANVTSQTFRLEGIDSQFSPFVGAKVEISGEVKSPVSAGPPTLIVELVQRISAKC